MKKKTSKHVNRSIRLPEEIWNIIKKISARNYRSLNSQFVKMAEDWLVDHDYLDDTKRTRMDE
jgi:predicted urease superfamily metal-dependent hydrolase